MNSLLSCLEIQEFISGLLHILSKKDSQFPCVILHLNLQIKEMWASLYTDGSVDFPDGSWGQKCKH